MSATPFTDANAMFGDYVRKDAPMVSASLVRELETDRDRLLGQRQDQAVAIDALKAAITGLLKFHQEGDDGAELPREYWSPGYREAVEHAESLVGSNVELTGSALLRSPG